MAGAQQGSEERGEGQTRGEGPAAGGGGTAEIPAAEWAVAGMGALLVVAVLGFLLYTGLRGADAPPDIVVERGAVVPGRGGYALEFRAVNYGDSTAQGVTVEGTLRAEDGGTERSEAHVQYVPGHSERRGALYFREDPRTRTVEVRALGYARP